MTEYYYMPNSLLLNAYNASAEYDPALCEEICIRVGVHEDFYNADGDNINRVMERAVEQLETSC